MQQGRAKMARAWLETPKSGLQLSAADYAGTELRAVGCGVGDQAALRREPRRNGSRAPAI